MVATYFTQFPQEVDRVMKEIEEQEEVIDTRRQEREKEIKAYVHSLSKQELRNRLLTYLLEEMTDRNHF